jgi:hypothetical protein
LVGNKSDMADKKVVEYTVAKVRSDHGLVCTGKVLTSICRSSPIVSAFPSWKPPQRAPQTSSRHS